MSTETEPEMSVADKAEAILAQIIKAKGGKRREGQVTMARVVAEKMREQTPLLLEGSTGIGKALDVETPIPTPRGFKRLGDLVVGDLVYNEDGKAVRVTEAFEVMRSRPCFRVTFSDGSSFIADGGHEWNTLTAIARRRAGSDIDAPYDPWLHTRTVTTTQMRESLRAGTGANHQIPLARPLEAGDDAASELPLDPYTLGMWLFAPRLRNSDTLRAVALAGATVPGFTEVPGRGGVFRADEQTLLALESLGVDAATRTIPDRYLFRGEQDRKRLLAGIVDVRGVVTNPPRSRGQVRVEHEDTMLLDAFHSLLASLGIRGSRGGTAFGPNPDGVAETKGAKGYVTYSPECDPFLLAADKRAKLAMPEPITLAWRTKRRSVVSIEPVESVPVRCITVDSPRHLYLAGTAMIPTHNSIGYLAGALANGGPALIAPHTKALQDQLVHDLEILGAAYDADDPDSPISSAPTFTVIKGRASYACLNKLEGAAGDGEQEALDVDVDGGAAEPTSEVGKQVKMIHEWVKDTETGDRSDLPEPVTNKVWSTVSVTSDDCIGSKCAFASECFANKAREAAADVDFIVTNHKFLSMAMKIPDLLPDTIKSVTVDEAHEFASTISETFGTHLSAKYLSDVLKSAKPIGESSKAGEKLLEDVVKFVEKIDELPKPKGDDREHPTNPKVVDFLTKLWEMFEQLSGRVRYLPKGDEDEKSAAEALAKSLDNVKSSITMMLEGHTDTQVVWSNLDSRSGGLVLNAAEFDSSETIFSLLLARFRSVVFTSATLTIAGDFSLTAQEHGFGKHGSPFAWQTVPSPFNYPEQGRIFYPPDMPDPTVRTPEGMDAYYEAVGKVAVRAALAADGRALVLCSSRASVEAVSSYLREHLPARNRLLVQDGELPPKHLAQEFTNDPHSVLVGTRSFWTGISVEGDTCAVTIVDKLPFPPPTDPIIAARCDKADRERGKWSGFNEVSVPEAIRTVVQGVGREIRTVTDRGVVIVCDPRIAPSGKLRKNYATKVQRSLPPFSVARTWEEAEEFLAHINETANDAVANDVVVEDEAAGEDGLDV